MSVVVSRSTATVWMVGVGIVPATGSGERLTRFLFSGGAISR